MSEFSTKDTNNLTVFKRLSNLFNLILAVLVLLFIFTLPNPLFKSPTSYVVEDDRGELLSAGIAADGQWRFPEDEIVPQKFIDCIITFEDKRFFSHTGFDVPSLARAVYQNIKSKKVVSGGSTLSMQVIRLSRNKERTIWQKVQEIFMAFRLELSYSKKDVLAIYAANAPFGSNVVGLEAASWRYFGRKPSLLSWGEMATLAVLPNAPSLIHPGRNRVKLLTKRNNLLQKLVAQKIINKETARLAKLEPLPLKPLPLPQLAPHLLDRFKKDFPKLNRPSTTVKTTVKANLQKNVSAILQNYQSQYAANGINNLAALVLDVESGNALAYVGNIYKPENAEFESHVDMIPALRSPGSTLKPLLYAAMLNDGMILPNTLLPDIPTQIAGYTPENANLGYDGAISASKALSRSLNIPAVKMLQRYKYERFHQFLRNTGINTLNKPADFYGLSMILGGCETSIWQLAGTYAAMARTLNHYQKYDGKYQPADYHDATYIKKEVKKLPLQNASVINYAALWYTFNAMEEVMRPGEEILWQQFSSSQKIAWKTGTSFGYRDGWAIGVTPKYVVCVWAGNADGEGRSGLTGISTAAPVMFNIFGLLPASGSFNKPYAYLSNALVCAESGFKAGINCDNKINTTIPLSGIKSGTCPYHQLVHLNQTQTKRVNSDCLSPDKMTHKSWFVLPAAMEYYYKVRHKDYQELPPFDGSCSSNDEDLRPIELIYPKNNAKVYIPIEIDGKRGKTIFNAALSNQKGKLFWSLDHEYIATTTDFHSLQLSPPPGKHTLTLTDDNGNRLVHNFTVLDKHKSALN